MDNNEKTLKEKLIEYVEGPKEDIASKGQNRMGCFEVWYDPFFAMRETFSLEQIKSMSDKEINNLIKLAKNIQDNLY